MGGNGKRRRRIKFSESKANENLFIARQSNILPMNLDFCTTKYVMKLKAFLTS